MAGFDPGYLGLGHFLVQPLHLARAGQLLFMFFTALCNDNQRTANSCFRGRPHGRGRSFFPPSSSASFQEYLCPDGSTNATIVVVVMRHRGVQRSKARGRGVGRWRHLFGKYAD